MMSPEGPFPAESSFRQAELAAELRRLVPGPEVSGPDAEPAEAVDPVTEQLETNVKRTLAERHPDWPPITLEIYFSAHGTGADIAGLANHVPGAHIYLYEGGSTYGMPEEAVAKAMDTHRLQAAANKPATKRRWGIVGRRVPVSDTPEPTPPPGNSFVAQQMQALRHSGVVVENIDLQHSDPIQGYELDLAFHQLYRLQDTFDATLAQAKEGLTRIAELQDQREQIMVARFEEKLEAILAQHPELRQQRGVRVLASIGSSHTRLSHKFREAGVTTQRSFPELPYTYNLLGEIQRTIAYGREPSRELLARGYLEDLTLRALSMELMKSQELNADDLTFYTRRVAEAFSESEIEALFEQDRTGALKTGDLRRRIAEKGLPLPHDVAELAEEVAIMKQARGSLR